MPGEGLSTPRLGRRAEFHRHAWREKVPMPAVPSALPFLYSLLRHSGYCLGRVWERPKEFVHLKSASNFRTL